MHRRILLSVVIVLLALLTPTANAEVEHPRQQWLRASTAGLFLHWGMFTAPKHLDCAEWERDVTGGGWSADYWVDEARKLGASYIVLATFHSRLGYARPWPSAIPGSCSTKRDLLGELVKAGKAKDVKIILYVRRGRLGQPGRALAAAGGPGHRSVLGRSACTVAETRGGARVLVGTRWLHRTACIGREGRSVAPAFRSPA